MKKKKYKKKPVVIEAVQLAEDQSNRDEIISWIRGKGTDCHACQVHDKKRKPLHEFGIIIATLEGSMLASPGDYIIMGIQGEFYACKPDIFKATYQEEVDYDDSKQYAVKFDEARDNLARFGIGVNVRDDGTVFMWNLHSDCDGFGILFQFNEIGFIIEWLNIVKENGGKNDA